MLKRFASWLRNQGNKVRPIEGYGGFMSDYAEWHSFTHGIYHGLTETRGLDGIPKDVMQNPDVKLEPHYAKGGYVIGTGIRWSMIGAGGFGIARLVGL